MTFLWLIQNLWDGGLSIGKGKMAFLRSDNILERIFSKHHHPQQHPETPYLEIIIFWLEQLVVLEKIQKNFLLKEKWKFNMQSGFTSWGTRAKRFPDKTSGDVYVSLPQ